MTIKGVTTMPMTVEREKLAQNILALTDEEVSAVAVFVRNLREDEQPLSDDELTQMAESDEDIAAGRLTPWKEARRRLEAPTSEAPARGLFS
jgi:EAL domain-containing protein (putative c-di-GMP-specific phosphodiesterase class I)